MIHTIMNRLYSILAAPGLYAGGEAYPSGWPGVTQPDSGDAEKAGWINLYRRPYANASDQQRPAIYLGTEAFQGTDRLYTGGGGGRAIAGSGPNRLEYRTLFLPLLLITNSSVNLYDAMSQREQLLNNVMSLLWTHIGAEADSLGNLIWWEMVLPGNAAGGQAQIMLRASATGGMRPASEASATLPVQINYRRTGLTPA